MMLVVHPASRAVREANARACRRDSVGRRGIPESGAAQHRVHRCYSRLLHNHLGGRYPGAVARVAHEQYGATLCFSM